MASRRTQLRALLGFASREEERAPATDSSRSHSLSPRAADHAEPASRGANPLDFAVGIWWSVLAWPNMPLRPAAGCAGRG